MQANLRQSVGIDMAKNDFVACFGILNPAFDTLLSATKKFANTQAGFEKLQQWANKQASQNLPIHYVMEATGVYHQKLAQFLDQQKENVSVVLPQKAKSFAKTLKTKTVTDKESSKALAVMGLEKKLDLWHKPDVVYGQVKQLTREREQVQKQLTRIKNQIHAEESGAWPLEKSLERMYKHKQLLEGQITEIGQDLQILAEANPVLKKKLKHILTITGVGMVTALTVIGETNGFELIKNKKQLVSYAGYDVKERESGTSVHGKARISHHGNRHIRKAMYMPALTSVRHNELHKNQYKNLVSKHGIKMKALVAIQRKQLVLIYTIWKKEEDFVKNYQENENDINNNNKKIEQPEKTALNELVHDRSLVC